MVNHTFEATESQQTDIKIWITDSQNMILKLRSNQLRDYYYLNLVNALLTLLPRSMALKEKKLSHGAKMIQLGSLGKIFRKTFGIREEEKLLQAFPCYLYTTAGAIAGILFVSTERVAFCGDRPMKTYSTTGKLLKFHYKVSISLRKIQGGRESMNIKRQTYSSNYLEVVTVDNFSFWFLGFVNYEKTLRYLHHAIGLERFISP